MHIRQCGELYDLRRDTMMRQAIPKCAGDARAPRICRSSFRCSDRISDFHLRMVACTRNRRRSFSGCGRDQHSASAESKRLALYERRPMRAHTFGSPPPKSCLPRSSINAARALAEGSRKNRALRPGRPQVRSARHSPRRSARGRRSRPPGTRKALAGPSILRPPSR